MTLTPNIVPPEGYWYQQPETGAKLQHGSLSGLVEMVILHRRSFGMARIGMNEVMQDVQDQICQRVPCNFCEGCEHPEWKLSADNILSAGKALLAMLGTLLSGSSPFVSQEVADARAETCSRCFHNRGAGGCGYGCDWKTRLASMLGITIGDRATPFDDRLNACEICACHCRVIAHFDGSILKAGTTKEQQQAYEATGFCWKANL